MALKNIKTIKLEQVSHNQKKGKEVPVDQSNLKYTEAEKKVFSEYDQVCSEIEQMKSSSYQKEHSQLSRLWSLMAKGTDHSEELAIQIEKQEHKFRPLKKQWEDLHDRKKNLCKMISEIIRSYRKEKRYVTTITYDARTGRQTLNGQCVEKTLKEWRGY